MPVVEGADELYAPAQEHPVAEDVAGHVPDARDGKVLALDVGAQLPEVPLHRLPRAAGGDRHRLVVVARGAARSEGVAEPETVLLRDAVGDVGERGRSFVGGHHQVRVILIVTHHPLWRLQAVGEVVGQVQQAADKRFVAGHHLVHHRLTVSAGRGTLDDETALGADRHDHRVLDRLGLHEPQDFGAEVLLSVGPADATSSDLATSEVNPLSSRRVDEDLEHRARQGQLRYSGRVQLEREVRFWLAVRAGLKVVGSHGR